MSEGLAIRNGFCDALRSVTYCSASSQLLGVTPPQNGAGNSTQFDGRGGNSPTVSSSGSLHLTDLDGDSQSLTANLEASAQCSRKSDRGRRCDSRQRR
jgi:hypothetical protein